MPGEAKKQLGRSSLPAITIQQNKRCFSIGFQAILLVSGPTVWLSSSGGTGETLYIIVSLSEKRRNRC